MKKAILAMCVVGLAVACNKKDDDKSPAAAPAPTNTEKQETGGPEAGPVATRLSINQKVKFVSLGQGVGANQEFKEKCLKGEEKYTAYDSANFTYRLKKSGTTVTAEMVGLTGESTLTNPDVNAKGKSKDDKEFESKCGSKVVMKMYTGVRVSQSYEVSKEQAENIKPFEMKGSAEMRSQEFMDKVKEAMAPQAKESKGEKMEVAAQEPKTSSVKIEGVPGGNSAVKASDLAGAMDEVKKLAGGQKAKGEEVVKGENAEKDQKGRQVEVDAYDYSAEMKSKAVAPKAETKGEEGKSETKGEVKPDDGKPADSTPAPAPAADDGSKQPASDDSKK